MNGADQRLTVIRRLTPLLVALHVGAAGVAIAGLFASPPPRHLAAGLLVAFVLAHRVAVRVRREGATFDIHPGELLVALAVGTGLPPLPAAVAVTLHCLLVDAAGTRQRRGSFRGDWQRRTKVIASGAVNVIASVATWATASIAAATLPDAEPTTPVIVALVAGTTYGVVNSLLVGSLVDWVNTGRWGPTTRMVRGLLGPVVPQAVIGSLLAVLVLAIHPLAALLAVVAVWPLPGLLQRHQRLAEIEGHIGQLVELAAEAGRSDAADVGEEVGGAVAGLLRYASGQVRDTAPVGPEEVGAQLPDGSWLVVSDPIDLALPDPEDQPLLAGLGAVTGMLVETGRERARHADELEADPLTGLANRAGLRRAVDRLSPDEPIAVLFLDLDHFKPVNDTFGHDAGDRALAEIARRLRGQLRSIDIAARVGGDEFLLVLPSLGDPLVAEDVADRVARAVANPLAVADDQHVRVETAIGIALGPAGDFSDLVVAADTAMFSDKRDRSRGR